MKVIENTKSRFNGGESAFCLTCFAVDSPPQGTHKKYEKA
jgi:hypothetical protein